MIILAIRFAAELLGVAAAAVVGASVPLAHPAPPILGAASAVAFMVFWAVVAAPKARNRLAPRTRELVGTAALLLVAGLLAATGQPGVATAYAVMVVVDHALILARDPRPLLEPRLAVARH